MPKRAASDMDLVPCPKGSSGKVRQAARQYYDISIARVVHQICKFSSNATEAGETLDRLIELREQELDKLKELSNDEKKIEKLYADYDALKDGGWSWVEYKEIAQRHFGTTLKQQPEPKKTRRQLKIEENEKEKAENELENMQVGSPETKKPSDIEIMIDPSMVGPEPAFQLAAEDEWTDLF